MVLLGPHEHHSNLLPWRESCARCFQLPEDSSGRLDRAALAAALAQFGACGAAPAPLVVGAFCAESNVTGVVADVDGISMQLHAAGALAVWDYAAGAAGLTVDMNPVVLSPGGGLARGAHKDAVILSPHKLPGGPGAAGVLVAKRGLFRNPVPSQPGGGTVFFVTENGHRYLSNREVRLPSPTC